MVALIPWYLESLESTQLNLGLYTTRVTAEDLHRAIADAEGTAPSSAEVEAVLQDLVAQGEVIEWAPGLFRSRIAETVRCLRLLRRRLWDRQRPWQPGSLAYSPLLVEDIRVEFRPRTRPRWTDVPTDQAVPSEVGGLVRSQFLDAIARRGITSMSRFQARAIAQLYDLVQKGNPHDEAVIISGDTGAGKTEAFLFPILLDILSESPEQRRHPGVRAVLVYPRIRLARNQLSRLLRYLSLLQEAGGPRLTVGIQNGDVRSNLRDIRAPWAANARPWPSARRENREWIRLEIAEECVQVDEEGNRCDGHYWFAADDPGVEAGCPTLVCERCGHTVDCLHVTKASLEASAPDILIITDVSLSQWLAREKYTHLWGLWEGETVTVALRFLVLDEVHLYDALKGAHIARLIKRFQARVRLAYQQRGDPMQHPIVIGVSATLHDERRFLSKLLDVDPQDAGRYGHLHVVKPQPDELVPTEGRERYIFIRPRHLSPTPSNPEFRVNDQTAAIQIVMCAMHNLKDDVEWRGLAFFDSINDLRQFRNNYDARRNEGWSLEHEDDFQTPSANQDELFRIRTDIFSRDFALLLNFTNVETQSPTDRTNIGA